MKTKKKSFDPVQVDFYLFMELFERSEELDEALRLISQKAFAD